MLALRQCMLAAFDMRFRHLLPLLALAPPGHPRPDVPATIGAGIHAGVAELGVEVSCYIEPCVLNGDFDGDGKVDVAALVVRKDRKRGIAILPARGKPSLLGAGRSLLHGGDDFTWMDHWQVYARGPVAQGSDEGPPPRLRGDALLVEKKEAASALIYWDGKEFRWYQQGD